MRRIRSILQKKHRGKISDWRKKKKMGYILEKVALTWNVTAGKRGTEGEENRLLFLESKNGKEKNKENGRGGG